MNIVNKSNKITTLFYLFFIVIGYILVGNTIKYGKILLLISIGYFIYQIYFYKKNQIFILFGIYALSYYLYLVPYYYSDIYYAIQYNLITVENTNKLLFLQSLFSGIFYLFLKIIPFQKINFNLKSDFESRKIYCICTLLMLYIFLFKLKGESILYSKYGTKEINNPYLEYYVIFFILAWRYIKNKKFEYFILFLTSIYIFKLLLFGLRLAALFQLILIFILYFENKIRSIWLIILGISLFIFFSFLSFFRVGINLNSIYVLFGLIEKDNIRWFQTNQGDVWMSSSMYLDLYKENIFNLEVKLKSIIGFWSSLIISSKYVYKEAYFRNFAQQFYLQKVGGGGITAIYLYIWYWYFGVVLFPIFLAKFVNRAYTHKKSIYGLFLMVIFIRWYSYNILIVFKMGLYLIVIDFLLYNFFNKRNYTRVERGKDEK